MEFKYFTEKTDPLIKGLIDELLFALDSAREKSGVGYRITDGLRTRAANKDPNAVKDSAHLSGKAADVDCNDGSDLYRMLYGILSYFCRIGIYVKFAPGSKTKLIPTHLHVDVDHTKPQKTMWIELER